MTDAPILFEAFDNAGWLAFRPASPFWARRAAEHYKPGQRYELVEHQDRSDNSHRHFFATLHECFQNLPDALLDEYPTEDRLRRKLLIKGGFCSEQTIPCATKTEAQRWADVTRSREPDSVVVVRGSVVRIYTAESMRIRGGMDRKRFQEAKTFILSELSKLLSVPVGEIEKARAA